MEPPQHLQKSLSQHSDKRHKKQFEETASAAHKAHLTGNAVKGSSLFLTTLPTSAHTRMRCSHYRLALRNWLFMPPCDYMPAKCKCGAVFADSPDHFHSCVKARRGGVTVRHNIVRDCLVAIARDHRLSVTVEPIYDSAGAGSDRLRPDLTVVSAAAISMVDVTISNAASPSNAQLTPTQLLNKRARDKHNKYDRLAEAVRAKFVPFVLTSSGGLGDEALELVRELVMRGAHAHHDDQTVLAKVQFALRRLSMAVHRGNARMIEMGLMQLRIGSVVGPCSTRHQRR